MERRSLRSILSRENVTHRQQVTTMVRGLMSHSRWKICCQVPSTGFDRPPARSGPKQRRLANVNGRCRRARPVRVRSCGRAGWPQVGQVFEQTPFMAPSAPLLPTLKHARPGASRGQFSPRPPSGRAVAGVLWFPAGFVFGRSCPSLARNGVGRQVRPETETTKHTKRKSTYSSNGRAVLGMVSRHR